MSSDQSKIIKVVQSSTRKLAQSFLEKAELLSGSAGDVRNLIREGYDAPIAFNTARKMFGSEKVKFLAIDGTKSEDQRLDILIFYAAAFGYQGEVDFNKSGCTCSQPSAVGGSKEISTAIPIHELDAGNILGIISEGGIEIDPERLPSALMHLSEYYLGVRTLLADSTTKIIIFDRQLAIDVGHLISNVTEVMQNDQNLLILNGMSTQYGAVTPIDLELSRMLHPNSSLKIPAPRSQLVKYAAINYLLNRNNTKASGYEELLSKIGANTSHLKRLSQDLQKLDEKFGLFENNDSDTLVLKDGIEHYWERVISAALAVAEHIFNAPDGEHPLLFTRNRVQKWITTSDLEYLTLMMIYCLLRLAWQNKILIIGIIKDMGAAELIKTVIPILEDAKMLRLQNKMPPFNNDRMLLQTFSVTNPTSITPPWNTFEFDACFRTMVPPIANASNMDEKLEGRTVVRGAFKNLISSERMFVKSYMQLWKSDSNPKVRSFVFSYDRPCYPDYDLPSELTLYHQDNKVQEEIKPIIHYNKSSDLSHLVMAILSSMAIEPIPECIGHNYPLFLADKKAKAILHEAKSTYLAAVTLELAHNRLDQEPLFGPSFRQFRTSIERTRRRKN